MRHWRRRSDNSEADFRGGLPRHLSGPGSRAAYQAARRRRHVHAWSRTRLTERAADQVGAETLKPLLSGPTALTFVRGDAALAAKAIADQARATQLAAVQGWLDERRRARRQTRSARSRVCLRAKCSTGSSSGSWPRRSLGSCARSNALVGGLAVALGQVQREEGVGRDSRGRGPRPRRRRRLPRSRPLRRSLSRLRQLRRHRLRRHLSRLHRLRRHLSRRHRPRSPLSPFPLRKRPPRRARRRGAARGRGARAEEASTADQAEPASEPAQDDNQTDASAQRARERRSDQGGLTDGNKHTGVDRGAQGHLGARARRAHQGAGGGVRRLGGGSGGSGCRCCRWRWREARRPRTMARPPSM